MTARLDLQRTKEIQWEASDPASSAWVVANAGSGKTHVLTQRVVRLLLAGSPPASILCLTFTKTAAAEMSRRIFGTLAGWTTATDAELSEAMAGMQGRLPTNEELRRARRLFARALETPGGLKIQTIHAFCEKLLHQFPFEANVPGRFEVLDDVSATALIAQARAEIMASAATGGDRLSRAMRYLAENCTDFAISAGVGAALARPERILRWFVEAGEGHDVEDAVADLRRHLNLEAHEDTASICREICDTADWGHTDCGELAEALAQSLAAGEHAYDRSAHTTLAEIIAADDEIAAAAARVNFFLSQNGAWAARGISQRFSAAFRRRDPSLDLRFDKEATRLLTLLEKFQAARTVDATEALLVVADAIIDAYRNAKRAAGALDFTDLIVKARDLLSRTDAADWVRYKMDQRLDHILVDEAQDTSPDQWAIVEALASDFFAGSSASEGVRTLFAVGDDKQSIFGFQGAAPRMLADMQRLFEKRAGDAGLEFRKRPLALSFRSTEEVLSAVDAVFGHEGADPVSEWAYEPHSANRADEPGRVIVWPRKLKVKAEEPQDWTASLDEPTAAEVSLANDIAAEIKTLIGRPLPSGKLVRSGEILILVRKRDAFVSAMNRALREHDIAAAGSDRIAVASHIASLDLLALADFVLLPEDDLQLAALLKSPLIGLDDDDLMRFAPDRDRRSLWSALQADRDPASVRAVERLRSWLAMADRMTPFRFFAMLIGPQGGRLAFRSRLGSEVDDVLDAFLGMALAYERREAPTMQGFAAFVRANETDIKREPEGEGAGVRVMTVHGAKGLEADVVFLVDTGGSIVVGQHRDQLVPVGGKHSPAFFWRRRREEAPAAQRTADQLADAETEREYSRLLYVAMTRARDLLYVCGIAGPRTPPNCWYRRIAGSLAPAEAQVDDSGEYATAFSWPPEPREPLPVRKAAEPGGDLDAQLPPWLTAPAPSPVPPPRPLRPSRALAEPEEAEMFPRSAASPSSLSSAADALLRGSAVHRLLQSLPDVPPDARRQAAERFLAALEGMSPDLAREIVVETEATLSDPLLAPFLGPGARAEVALVGEMRTARGTYAVSGQIDRLLRTAKGWHILDFKTDRAIPPHAGEIDSAYVLQLALYRRLLLDMDPDAEIAATLFYTAGPKAIPVSPEAMERSLEKLVGEPAAVS